MTDHKPGPELDALMASKVMEWPGLVNAWAPRPRDTPCFWYPDPRGDIVVVRDSRVRGWSPSTDWDAAFEVVAKLLDDGWPFAMESNHREWWCDFTDRVGWDEKAKTGPHAICLAALATKDTHD